MKLSEAITKLQALQKETEHDVDLVILTDVDGRFLVNSAIDLDLVHLEDDPTPVLAIYEAVDLDSDDPPLRLA